MADEKRLDETQDDQGAANATDDESDDQSGASSDQSAAPEDQLELADDGNERADSKSMRSKARTGALIAAGVVAAAAIVAAAVWAVSAVLDDDDDFSVAVDYATVATPDFFLGIPDYGDHRDHHHYERGYRHHGPRHHRHDHHGHRDDRHHRDGYRYHNYSDRQWGLNLAPLVWLLERFLGLGDWLRGYDDWYDDYRFDRDDRRYRDDGWYDDYDRYDWYDDDGWSGRDDGMSDDDWNGRDDDWSGDDGSPMPEGGMSFGFGLPEGLINEELLDLLGEELVEQLLRQLFGNDAPFQFGFAIPEALPETQQPQDSPDQFEGGIAPGQIPLDPETLNQLLGRLFGSGLPLNGDGSPSGLEGLEDLLDGVAPEPATTTTPVPAVLPT